VVQILAASLNKQQAQQDVIVQLIRVNRHDFCIDLGFVVCLLLIDCQGLIDLQVMKQRTGF
jgi:hypothetical protein